MAGTVSGKPFSGVWRLRRQHRRKGTFSTSQRAFSYNERRTFNT